MRATGRNLWRVGEELSSILAWNAIQVRSLWIHIWPLVSPLSDRSGLCTRLMAQQDHMERCGWNPVQHEYLLLDHEEQLQLHILVQHCGWQGMDLEVQVNTIGFNAKARFANLGTGSKISEFVVGAAGSDYAQVERRSVTFLDQTRSRGGAFALKDYIKIIGF